jgi:hypothetical protein
MRNRKANRRPPAQLEPEPPVEQRESDASDDDASHDDPRGWSRLALLGDSPLALALSLGLLLMAAGISGYLSYEQALSPEERAYRALGPVPAAHVMGRAVVYELTSDAAVVDQITAAMRQAYRREGVLALRGLVPADLVKDLQAASAVLIQEQQVANHKKRFAVRGKQFYTVQHGVLFREASSLWNASSAAPTLQQQDEPTDNPFWTLALHSRLASAAALLLDTQDASAASTNDDAATVRILRDIFLAKDNDPYVCGWHVDDHGFWPAQADAPGVNAWVALDDYPTGGMQLAVGSHRAPWREAAYQSTGAAPTVPVDGFTSAADMVERREGSGTCNIATAAPHLERRLTETSRVFENLQAGDVLLHDRWLFHKTVSPEAEAPVRRRYSLRFGPGSAVLPPGYGTEPSILYEPTLGGRTAQQACAEWPWYPQVWPAPLSSEQEARSRFVQEIWPAALQLQKSRQKEMKPHLQQLAQRQKVHPQANNRLYDFSEGYS